MNDKSNHNQQVNRELTPEGIQLKELLNQWDVNCVLDSIIKGEEGRLPQYALTDKIQYSAEGILGPEVNIPFRYNPSKEEVEAVAYSLAKFISQHIGELQEVMDISSNIQTQYFIQAKTERRNPLLTHPNYRVGDYITFLHIKGAEGFVTIRREWSCKHDEGTLEAYALSIKTQEK